MTLQLRNMRTDQVGTVSKISAKEELGRRIRDLGIVPGVKIKLIGAAPLNDPVALKVRDMVLTLRNSEADHIFVEVEG